MNERRTVETKQAAAAIGPYSQAIAASGWIWISGQIGLPPSSGQLVTGGVEAEARQVLRNLLAILEAAGSGPERMVQATIYLADMRDFEVVNRVYAGAFGENPPARVCVEVSGLPKGARVEIAGVALS